MISWYVDDYGDLIYDDDGHPVVCDEYSLTDADLDRYAVEVQNGDGYYNSDGWFVRYRDD